MVTLRAILASLPVAAVLTGCVVAPREAQEVKQAAAEVGMERDYLTPYEKRSLPELPAEPTWRDVLRRAFYANGDLEAAYHEWAMAVTRIDQRGTWPEQPLEVGFEYMFSGANMKAWDRTTVMAGPMDPVGLPQKAYQAAKVAMRDAEAAGERFLAAKFDLQRRVLMMWQEYVLAAERVRVQRENVSLLRILTESAEARVRTGAAQQELLRADVELRMAENTLGRLEADVRQTRARLASMIGVDPATGVLPAPTKLDEPRFVPTDDRLLSLGVTSNPALGALAKDVEGRRDALERARMEWLPDVRPTFSFTGSVSQAVGLGVSLPTAVPKIRAMVEETRADVRRTEAMYRQGKLDRAGQFVAAMYSLRNAEREATVFETEILPAAEATLANARQGYTAGRVMFQDFVEAQRALLDVRLMVAEVRTMRETRLAELEALAGADVETLDRETTATP